MPGRAAPLTLLGRLPGGLWRTVVVSCGSTPWSFPVAVQDQGPSPTGGIAILWCKLSSRVPRCWSCRRWPCPGVVHPSARRRGLCNPPTQPALAVAQDHRVAESRCRYVSAYPMSSGRPPFSDADPAGGARTTPAARGRTAGPRPCRMMPARWAARPRPRAPSRRLSSSSTHIRDQFPTRPTFPSIPVHSGAMACVAGDPSRRPLTACPHLFRCRVPSDAHRPRARPPLPDLRVHCSCSLQNERGNAESRRPRTNQQGPHSEMCTHAFARLPWPSSSQVRLRDQAAASGLGQLVVNKIKPALRFRSNPVSPSGAPSAPGPAGPILGAFGGPVPVDHSGPARRGRQLHATVLEPVPRVLIGSSGGPLGNRPGLVRARAIRGHLSIQPQRPPAAASSRTCRRHPPASASCSVPGRSSPQPLGNLSGGRAATTTLGWVGEPVWAPR